MKKKVSGLVGDLEIELKVAGEVVLLDLSGQIDTLTAEEITKAIEEHINKESFKVIVELSKVDYLDSAGLGALITLKSKLSERDGGMRLVGLKGKAKEVFELVGVLDLFDIYDSCEKALEHF